MSKPGPKLKPIDWIEFDKLASYQCTQREISSFFDISVATLERRCLDELGVSLADVWDKRKLAGKLRLRKIQFDIASGKGSGAATMAIFLGKQILGQENLSPPTENNYHLEKKEVKRTFQEFVEKAGYPAPFEAQLEMREFCFEETDPRILLGARGYGKSDYGTVLGTAYDVYLNGTNTTNLIISQSKTRNAAMIEEIANALIQNGIQLEKQNSTCIRVVGMIGKDHSVEVLTVRSSFRGRHPKRILMDDPVTEKDISPALREQVKRMYDEAFKLCTNICIIGQPVHADDLYAELRAVLLKMEVPHGTIPELDADLEAMKLAGVDRNSIEMSYHLRVPKDGAMIFSGLKSIDSLPPGDCVAFIDPSDGGDYTAISIVRGYMGGVAVEGFAWKLAWYNCLDDILSHLKRLGVRRVCFETNATGTQPIGQLRKIFGEAGLKAGVVGVHSLSNKHSVIVSTGSMAHNIHLSKNSDAVYTKQVKKYEAKSKHDDAPDSLARCLEWLGLIKGKG